MAKRCSGDQCAYGWGHRREHEEAARKGWRTRRQGEAKYLSKTFQGYEVHSHRNGKVILTDAEDGSTFELNSNEAREVVRQVRAQERLEERQQRLQQRNDAQARRELAREQQRQERISRQVENELFRNAIADVVGYGGIRNYKKDASGQRHLQEDVWQQIPGYYRARSDNRTAKTADEVASELAENYPYLGIETDADLAQAFKTRRFKQRERRAAGKAA